MPVRSGGRYEIDGKTGEAKLALEGKPKRYREPKFEGERVGGEKGAPNQPVTAAADEQDPQGDGEQTPGAGATEK